MDRYTFANKPVKFAKFVIANISLNALAPNNVLIIYGSAKSIPHAVSVIL